MPRLPNRIGSKKRERKDNRKRKKEKSGLAHFGVQMVGLSWLGRKIDTIKERNVFFPMSHHFLNGRGKNEFRHIDYPSMPLE